MLLGAPLTSGSIEQASNEDGNCESAKSPAVCEGLGERIELKGCLISPCCGGPA